MRKRVLLGLALLAAVCAGAALWLPWPSTPEPDRAAVPGEGDQALIFIPERWSVSSSSVEPLKEIYLPFLHRKLIGRKVRVLSIQGPGLEFTDGATTFVNTRLTRGKVVVLAETGQLLRAVLHENPRTGRLPGEMSLDDAEELYSSLGDGIKYVGLPGGKPQITLQEILNKRYRPLEPEGPQTARLIAAVYVLEANGNDPPKVFWHVSFYDFRGVPSAYGPGFRNHRFVLDASGKTVGEDTLP